MRETTKTPLLMVFKKHQYNLYYRNIYIAVFFEVLIVVFSNVNRSFDF